MHLTRAVKGNYVYNMLLTEAIQLFDVYNEVFNKKEKSTGCSRCRLNIAKALGKLYFDYQKTNNLEKPKRNGKGKTSKSRPKV